jgi:hypothetical protein
MASKKRGGQSDGIGMMTQKSKRNEKLPMRVQLWVQSMDGSSLHLQLPNGGTVKDAKRAFGQVCDGV